MLFKSLGFKKLQKLLPHNFLAVTFVAAFAIAILKYMWYNIYITFVEYKMIIRKADFNDLDDIQLIYQSARQFMSENGNPNQWGKINPPIARTEEDIRENNLYVVEDNNNILAVFYYRFGDDPTYKIIYGGTWLNYYPYGVIHRIAVSDKVRGKGIAGICFDFAYSKCKNLKIDTHRDNIPMQRALAKHGFKQCGIIHLANGDERIAFQKAED